MDNLCCQALAALRIAGPLQDLSTPMSAFESSAASHPSADLASLWQRSCERLATELPEQQFNTWIRPLPPAEISLQDGHLSLIHI